MKPLRLSAALLALGLITTTATPCEAAWNNVFQVTCWSCRPKTSSSYYVAPAPVYSYSAPVAGPCDTCQPAPQQCTTKYVQRCYYQPVTTYQTQSYYEPVTTYQTKTYYEPVTTYRYSCYYDPCSCSYQQVATPCTSYVARQQSCPVQSWVQRCAQVPVTSYQKSYYWEPQTSCCTPAPSCCTPTSSGGPTGPPPLAPPSVEGKPTMPPPLAPPKVEGGSTTGPYDSIYGGGMTGKDQPESRNRQLPPNGQLQAPSKSSPTLPPSAKLDRIAKADGPLVNGQVVSDSNAPKAGVKLTFVSAKRQAPDKTVTANAAGRFEVALPQGSWLIYVRSADGQQVYHSQIDVQGKQQTPIVLVSR